MKRKIFVFIAFLVLATHCFAKTKNVVCDDVEIYISSLGKKFTYFMTDSEKEVKKVLTETGCPFPKPSDFRTNPKLAQEVRNKMMELGAVYSFVFTDDAFILNYFTSFSVEPKIIVLCEFEDKINEYESPACAEVVGHFADEVRVCMELYDIPGRYYSIDYEIFMQDSAWETKTFEHRCKYYDGSVGTVHCVGLYFRNVRFVVDFGDESFGFYGEKSKKIKTTRVGTAKGKKIRKEIVTAFEKSLEESEAVLKTYGKNYSDEAKKDLECVRRILEQ